MTDRRYYYTDPLAAAWMAKHFGMKLLAEGDFDRLVDAGSRFIDCDDTFRELWQHDFSYLGKLHVHPDSLGLLEPIDGDAVEFDRWYWDRQRHDDLKDVLPQPHFGLVKAEGDWKHIFSSGTGWDRAPKGGRFALPLRIIQRNGTPFMWPESEAVKSPAP